MDSTAGGLTCDTSRRRAPCSRSCGGCWPTPARCGFNSATAISRPAGIRRRERRANAAAAATWTSRPLREGPLELPDKNLLGIPWRVALVPQDDGWILRNAIVWHKPNGMPESVTDRLSKRYEHVPVHKQGVVLVRPDAVRVEYSGDCTLSRTARTGATNKANSIAILWRADETPYPTADRRRSTARRGNNTPARTTVAATR